MGVETMVAATLVSGVAQYGQGKSNAASIEAQARINELQNDFQREMLDERKSDILAAGDEQAYERQQQLKQMLGAQKVAFAARGVEVEGELGQGLEDDARKVAEQDVKAIKNNAWKEAMGVEMDQMDLEMDTKFKNVQSMAQAQDAMAQGTIGIVESGVRAYGMAADAGWFKGGKKLPTKPKKTAYNYSKNSYTSRIG